MAYTVQMAGRGEVKRASSSSRRTVPTGERTSIQAILVGIDERRGWAQALRTAGELAQACGAVLIVVDLRPELDPNDRSAGPDDDVDHLQLLARHFPDLVIRGMTARGHGAHTLFALAPEVGADLVVVPEAVVQARWRRAGLERGLAGGCPVVVVPAGS